jgi:hypothetical protein
VSATAVDRRVAMRRLVKSISAETTSGIVTPAIEEISARLAAAEARIDQLEAGRTGRPSGKLDDEEMARLRAWIVANPSKVRQTKKRRTLERCADDESRHAWRRTAEAAWEEMGLALHDLEALLDGGIDK